MTPTANVKNLPQGKIRFSMIADHILTFLSHNNMITEAKSVSIFEANCGNVLLY